MIEPAQPAFGFMAPITTLGMRACTIAPAHIWQGSRVTYMVHSSRRQSPVFAGFADGRELSVSERIFVSISAVVTACNDFVTGYNYAAYRYLIKCICFFLPVLLPVSYIFHLVSYLSAPCVIIYLL